MTTIIESTGGLRIRVRVIIGIELGLSLESGVGKIYVCSLAILMMKYFLNLSDIEI
jgi:hypothetical protein